MLDLQYIRDNQAAVQKACDLKNKKVDVSAFLAIDSQKNKIQFEIDDLRFQQKEAGKNREIEKATSLKENIQTLSEEFRVLAESHQAIWETIPNMIHPDVAIGKNEDENVVLRVEWTKPSFSFTPRDHQILGENLGILDKNKASVISWSRFFFLIWDLARLQNAVVQFSLNAAQDPSVIKQIIKEKNLKIDPRPFTLVVPPLIISQETMWKMWRLHPKEDRYCLEEDNQVLIWSAEHCLGPLHMDETIAESELPVRYIAFTPAFRREAGSYWKDTGGIIRTHQFEKIEMESFCLPEHGEQEQELFTGIQEYLLRSLWLHYQVINICTGDMWAMDYKQIDMETWFPSQNKFRETHTSDYMTDYQARRLKTKYKKDDGETGFTHMNDATAFALWRILAALLENYQNEDGSINIPEVLWPYMGGQKIITKK